MSRYTKHNTGFAYHAQAIGFSASLYKPTPENIPGQASVSLSQTGGESFSVVRNFDWKGIFHFDEASAYVTGSSDPEQTVYSTLATVTVRGLNIANMVTADQIIARVSSHHERDKDGYFSGEARISMKGSSFHNLRVAGHPIHVTVDTRCAVQPFESCSEFVRERGGITNPAAGSASCTIADMPEIKEDEFEASHGRIVIGDFGTIYLASVIFKHGYRRISMLRAELGCPIGGTLEVSGGEGNGGDIWH